MLLTQLAMQMMSQRLPMKMFCLSLKISKNREKYLISNNPEINGENFGTLEKKILKEKSDPLNHNLNTNE